MISGMKKIARPIRFLLVLSVSLALFSGGFYKIGFGEKDVWAQEGSSAPYSFEDRGMYGYFTNFVDGYSLQVDKNMKVDMSNSAACAVLENYGKRIEIYKQYVGANGTAAYINYSNKFLQNTADHKLEYMGFQDVGANKVHITSWSRNKLARVKDDKNYYLVIDILKDRYIYTIFMKMSQPHYMTGGYMYLIENFTTFEPTVAGSMRATQANPKHDWNTETLALYNSLFYQNPKISWGLFQPNTAWLDYSAVQQYESELDYKFPILLNYTDFTERTTHGDTVMWVSQMLNNAYQRGKTVELTLQTTWQTNGNMVYDVLQGKYDNFLNRYARAVANFGHPVLFRLGNEMNGDWCPYSAYNTSRDTLVFKEFYKYIFEIFKKNGVKNAIWVWNPNGQSFPNYKWNEEIMYYPGDEYVDVVGLTAYNTGTYYHKYGERWQTFDELYRPIYDRYSAFLNQPFMITEFSCASMGGDKNAWIQNMFTAMKNYPRIRAAVWWDGADRDAAGNIARSYYINETPAIMQTFKNNINN